MPEDIWSAPVSTETTEGVSEANPPATPSEVVEPSTETETAATEQATTETNASAEASTEQAVESATTTESQSEIPDTPEVKRQARKLFFEVKDLGGEAVFNEAKDIYTSLQNPELDAKAKLSKIYQAAPRAYEEIQKELFFQYWDNPAQQELLVKEKFGASPAEIKELLAARGQIAPPSTPEQATQSVTAPTLDELAAMSNEEVLARIEAMKTQGVATKLPDEVQAKLQRLDALEKEFPQLKSQVSTFAEQQEAAKAEKITALGAEFVNEAMTPVVRMLEEAGLRVLPEDPPDEKAWKEEVWDTIITKTYNEVMSQPVAQDVEAFLKKLDRTSAWSKMRLAQAQAELSASKRLPIYLSQRQKQRESQTSNLGKDRPPVITGGQASLGSSPPLPTGRDAWNDPSEGERWKDIAQSVA